MKESSRTNLGTRNFKKNIWPLQIKVTEDIWKEVEEIKFCTETWLCKKDGYAMKRIIGVNIGEDKI